MATFFDRLKDVPTMSDEQLAALAQKLARTGATPPSAEEIRRLPEEVNRSLLQVGRQAQVAQVPAQMAPQVQGVAPPRVPFAPGMLRPTPAVPVQVPPRINPAPVGPVGPPPVPNSIIGARG